MRFDLPADPPNVTVPNSLNPNLGTSGKEYVWHCHILEHEEHDMMRPLVVV
jgi:spore coat protein A, manganese oxidase